LEEELKCSRQQKVNRKLQLLAVAAEKQHLAKVCRSTGNVLLNHWLPLLFYEFLLPLSLLNLSLWIAGVICQQLMKTS